MSSQSELSKEPVSSTVTDLDAGPDIDARDRALLDEEYGRRLEQERLKPSSLLRWPTVVCIIINRMIGSGIFSTPSTVVQLTQSPGIAILFWVAGSCAALCGTLMYMEYGLTSPRFAFRGDTDGVKLPLPRSGGDLFYLKDVIRKPAFLAICLYGVIFILFGNIAINSIAFGMRVLEAAGRADPTGWEARGIAIAVIVFSCALHSLWRIGGIRLNNALAVIKVLMLLLIFITGCLVWGGVFEGSAGVSSPTPAPNAFKDPTKDAYPYAQAYLAILWAFDGFNQANYVLGEVDQPKRNYKWPAFFAVLGVCILYLLVNIAYMLVVPPQDQKQSGNDIATEFFTLTYGTLSSDGAEMAPRVLAAFMAISALGNLIVMTFTAARVKQEIAKEGIVPFYNFFANNKVLFGAKDNPVPLGALILHGSLSIVLILCTSSLAPAHAYKILVRLAAYTLDAMIGVALAVGIFVLRFRSSTSSFATSSFLPAWLSMSTAALYGLTMAFPLITIFVPPSPKYAAIFFPDEPWYVTVTVSWCVVALGGLWFLGFKWLYPLRHPGKQLVVTRELLISDDDTLEHETITFDWLPGDIGDSTMREEAFIAGYDDTADGRNG